MFKFRFKIFKSRRPETTILAAQLQGETCKMSNACISGPHCLTNSHKAKLICKRQNDEMPKRVRHDRTCKSCRPEIAWLLLPLSSEAKRKSCQILKKANESCRPELASGPHSQTKSCKGLFLSLFTTHHSLFAFTLAEVLITLGIIGVVAALTIPTLMNKVEKDRNYNAMKKAYSTISDAASRVRADNANSMGDLATNSASFVALFKPYLKVLKSCNDSTDSANCYVSNSTPIMNLTGTANYGGETNLFSIFPKIITADGMVYIFNVVDSTCNTNYYVRNGQNEFCGNVTVDINGVQKPNAFGKDIFTFSINKYNVTPYMDYRSSEDSACDPLSNNVWNGVDCAHKAIAEGGIYYY